MFLDAPFWSSTLKYIGFVFFVGSLCGQLGVGALRSQVLRECLTQRLVGLCGECGVRLTEKLLGDLLMFLFLLL